MGMPKLFKEDTIKQLLGEKALVRLRTAYLREKAAKITPVTPKDIEIAQKYIDAPVGGLGAAGAFKRVAFKWITESKGAHKSFLRYTSDLLNQKKGAKNEKKAKKKF